MTKEPMRIAPVMCNLLAAAEAGTVVLAARGLTVKAPRKHGTEAVTGSHAPRPHRLPP